MNHWKNTVKNDRRRKNVPEASQTIDLSRLVYGKIPPQAKDLEEAVLGAVLLDSNAFDIVAEIIQPQSFYVEANMRIFTAIIGMAERRMPVDILTVAQELTRLGELEIVGGAYYVMQLTNKVVSAANVEAHARIVQQKYLQRQLIQIAGEVLSTAYEDTTDVFDLLDDAEAKLFDLTSGHLKSAVASAKTVYDKEISELISRIDKKEDITGVPSGFKPMDRVTYGWQPTDLIIIAARPSVGKTAFAINLAMNAVFNEYRSTGAAIFSLEMSKGQVMQRMISAKSEIRLDQVKRGKLNDDELKVLIKNTQLTLREAPIFIDDTPTLNIFELRAKCRRLVHNNGVGIIIIDYLQLMSGTGDKNGNREQEISKISRDLKALAKELNVPIIALSQLSREVEKRAGNMPQLSDLRESGAIEQDADMVMFLYRPDYQKEAREVDSSLIGEVSARIAKHRNGSLETIALRSDLAIQKFMDLPEPFPQQAPARMIPMAQATRRYEIESPPLPIDPEDELPF